MARDVDVDVDDDDNDIAGAGERPKITTIRRANGGLATGETGSRRGRKKEGDGLPGRFRRSSGRNLSSGQMSFGFLALLAQAATKRVTTEA